MTMGGTPNPKSHFFHVTIPPLPPTPILILLFSRDLPIIGFPTPGTGPFFSIKPSYSPFHLVLHSKQASKQESS